jgi:hypothetical protein
MTVTPYSLVATYQPISIFKIQERRIKSIRNASRLICQTTRRHIPNCRRHNEHHNSHNACPALKSTGRAPTALLLDLQKEGIPPALFCLASGTRKRGQSMHRQNSEPLSALCLQGVSPCSVGDRLPALHTFSKVFSSKRS